MSDHARNIAARLTPEYARAAGMRFLSDGIRNLSSDWQMVAETWVDGHHPVPLPGEDDEAFTTRMSELAAVYVDGIRQHLLDALGGAPRERLELDATEAAAALNGAAEQLSAAASVFTMVVDTLQAFIEEAESLHIPKTACLAIQLCIRVGQQTARELDATHQTLALEAKGYE